MVKITGRRNRRKQSLHGWLLWLVLTASFGLMGLSFGLYQNSLVVEGTVGSATLGVEFIGSPHVYAETLVARPQPEKRKSKPPPGIFYEIELGKGKDQDLLAKTPVLSAGYSGGKSISTSIGNAYPGDVYKLQYTVANTGTIPVVFAFEKMDNPPGIEVKNSLYADELLRQGQNRTEELTIIVDEDIKEATDLGLSVELVFKQRNAAE